MRTKIQDFFDRELIIKFFKKSCFNYEYMEIKVAN